jgi:hypothetical protein
MRGRGVFLNKRCMDNLFLNHMNSRQGIVKKKLDTIFEISIGFCIILKFFSRCNFGVSLFFLTIPKPLRQHPIF